MCNHLIFLLFKISSITNISIASQSSTVTYSICLGLPKMLTIPLPLWFVSHFTLSSVASFPMECMCVSLPGAISASDTRPLISWCAVLNLRAMLNVRVWTSQDIATIGSVTFLKIWFKFSAPQYWHEVQDESFFMVLSPRVLPKSCSCPSPWKMGSTASHIIVVTVAIAPWPEPWGLSPSPQDYSSYRLSHHRFSQLLPSKLLSL